MTTKIKLNKFKEIYPDKAKFKELVTDKIEALYGAEKPKFITDSFYSFDMLYTFLYNKYSEFHSVNEDDKLHMLMVNAFAHLMPSLYAKTKLLSKEALDLIDIPKLLSITERRFNEDADNNYASTETAYSSTPDDSQQAGTFNVENVKEKNIVNRKDKTIRVKETTNLLGKIKEVNEISLSGYVYDFVNSIEFSSLFEYIEDEEYLYLVKGPQGIQGVPGTHGKNGPAWLSDDYADLQDFVDNAPNNTKVKYNINKDGTNNVKGYTELVKVGANVLQIITKEEITLLLDAIETQLNKKVQIAGEGTNLPNGVTLAYNIVKGSDGHVYALTPFMTEAEWIKNVNDTMTAKDQADANKREIQSLKAQGKYIGTYTGTNAADLSNFPLTRLDGSPLKEDDRGVLKYPNGNPGEFAYQEFIRLSDAWIALGEAHSNHPHSGITLTDVSNQQDPKIATAKSEAITESKAYADREIAKIPTGSGGLPNFNTIPTLADPDAAAKGATWKIDNGIANMQFDTQAHILETYKILQFISGEGYNVYLVNNVGGIFKPEALVIAGMENVNIKWIVGIKFIEGLQ